MKVVQSLAAALFCTLAWLVADAGAITGITVVPSSDTVYTVNVTDIADAMAVDISLSYDPAILSNPVITAGPLATSAGAGVESNTLTPGFLRAFVYTASGSIKGSGLLATVTFTKTGVTQARLKDFKATVYSTATAQVPVNASISAASPSDTGSGGTTPVPVAGACGEAAGKALSSIPVSSALCSAGVPSAVAGSGPWNWSCNGINGGASASCLSTLAAAVVSGACGSSGGASLADKPTTNLCASGTPSVVAGSGPWSWSCSGANGGATSTCVANIYSPAPATSGTDSTAGMPPTPATQSPAAVPPAASAPAASTPSAPAASSSTSSTATAPMPSASSPSSAPPVPAAATTATTPSAPVPAAPAPVAATTTIITSTPAGGSVSLGTVTFPAEQQDKGREVKSQEPHVTDYTTGSPQPAAKTAPTAPYYASVPENTARTIEKQPADNRIQLKTVKGPLARFREYNGPRTLKEMSALFDSGEAKGAGIVQSPAIAVSDGVSMITVTVDFSADPGTPSFSLKGANLKDIRNTGEKQWELDALPQRGKHDVRLSILLQKDVVEIPLTVVPPVSRDVSGLPAQELDKLLSGALPGSAGLPFDLNNDGKQDYVDDYILIGHWLMKQLNADGAPAKRAATPGN